jgi:DNA-directed RNA polymerase specialized sigma24 family protein
VLIRESDATLYLGLGARAWTSSIQSLSKAYFTALLLTGSERLAESVVLTCIDDESGDELQDSLIDRAAVAAVRRYRDIASNERSDERTTVLPVELRRVMELASPQRHCFVLHVLLGWRRARCACVLRCAGRDVDELVCEAMKQLAGVAEKEA